MNEYPDFQAANDKNMERLRRENSILHGQLQEKRLVYTNKITEQDACDMRHLHDLGCTPVRIARIFRVSRSCVYEVLRGISWVHTVEARTLPELPIMKLRDLIKIFMKQMLRRHHNCRKDTAEALGIDVKTLYNHMKGWE